MTDMQSFQKIITQTIMNKKVKKFIAKQGLIIIFWFFIMWIFEEFRSGYTFEYDPTGAFFSKYQWLAIWSYPGYVIYHFIKWAYKTLKNDN